MIRHAYDQKIPFPGDSTSGRCLFLITFDAHLRVITLDCDRIMSLLMAASGPQLQNKYDMIFVSALAYDREAAKMQIEAK